jgi:hypothetical protein
MDNWNGIGSLLIACIEAILFVNLIVFAKKDKFNKTAMLILFILMIYQTLEFLMCQAGMDFPFIAYLAFVDIIFLPPLLLVLLASLFNKENKYLYLLFLPAIGFIIYYSFVVEEFAVTSCTVLYATYSYPLGDLYGFFYYLPVLISTIILIRTLNKSSNKRILYIAKVLLIGNIIISIPVIAGFVLMFSGSHYLIAKIESIMCKFAFGYAICLVIVSLYNSKKNDPAATNN